MYKKLILLFICFTSTVKSTESDQLNQKSEDSYVPPTPGNIDYAAIFKRHLGTIMPPIIRDPKYAQSLFPEELKSFVENPENEELFRSNKNTCFFNYSQKMPSEEYETARGTEKTELSKINRFNVLLMQNNKAIRYPSYVLFHKGQYHLIIDSKLNHSYNQNGQLAQGNTFHLVQQFALISHTPTLFNLNCFTVSTLKIESREASIRQNGGEKQLLPVITSETFSIEGRPTAKNIRNKRITATLACGSILTILAWVNFKAFNTITPSH